jgi:hypothetical protein
MARWCINAHTFECEVKYYPGKKNIVADTLSRLKSDPITPEIIKSCETLNPETEEIESCVVTRARQRLLDEVNNPLLAEKPSDDSIKAPLQSYIPEPEDITWSVEELMAAQNDDLFCEDIINKFKNKTTEVLISDELQNFLIIDKVLYRYRDIDENNCQLINIVIPNSLIKKAITSIHYNMHAGYLHTLFSFKLKYYHPQEKTIIRKYTESCEVCKILKAKVPAPIKINMAPIATKPFETVSFDFIGPLVKTDAGNKYILVVIDLFSRYTKLYAMADKNSCGVVDCLCDTFNNYGYPTTLISDNALEFTSNTMKLFSNIYSIKKKEVLPYSPQSNGIVERCNGRINKLLRLYVNSISHGQWDMYLGSVENTINNQLIDTLQDTPSYTLFGRDTHPCIVRRNISELYNYDNDEAIVKFNAKNNLLIQENIRATIINNTMHRNFQRNRHRRDKNIVIGSRVLIRNHRKSHKLDLSWLGPGLVTRIDRNMCEIKIGSQLIRSNVTHVIPLVDLNK